MADQKCPNCSANMILKNNRDGTTSYHCEYCGNIIDIQPKTTADKLFTFVNRAVNAINERMDPTIKQQEFIDELKELRDKATGKRRARLEKQIETEERALAAYRRARR